MLLTRFWMRKLQFTTLLVKNFPFKLKRYLIICKKSLHRTNEVFKNSKLQELLAAQKMIDDDIQISQNEKPKNLTSFKVQVENPESCTKKLCPYTIFMELARDISELF